MYMKVYYIPDRALYVKIRIINK